MAIATQDPMAVVAAVAHRFGPGSVERPEAWNAPYRLRAGEVTIEIWCWSHLALNLGGAMVNMAGRDTCVALLGIVAGSSYRTEAMLKANGVADVQRVAMDRILVPANQAMNVAFAFTG